MNNIIQIYDINTSNDDLQDFINKLKSVNVDINRYDYEKEKIFFEENEKVKRLIDFYGKEIFPVTLVNGEIVQIEKHLTFKQIISIIDISMKKIIRAGIETKKIFCQGCDNNNENCNKSTSCSGCNDCKNK